MRFLPLYLLLLATPLALPAAAPRPNILYFYVDDMGWGSIGPNAQAERRAKGLPSVQTPHLDKLAAEGMNFTRSYGCTVCSPARSSQQTGFHQGHTFGDRNDPDNAKKAMRADDVLLGDVLAAAGYVTGYWGKWGYGGSKEQANPQILNVQTLPTSHGYQYALTELHHVRAHTFFQPTLWSAPAAKGAVGGLELVPNTMEPYRGKADYPDQPSNHNHPKYPKTGYCDDAYAFAALDFVRAQARNSRGKDEPFFGLLAVQIPHAPFDEVATLPGWNDAYRDDPHFADLSEQSRQWAAMVTRIDAHFGHILAALEDPDGDGDTSDSVAENTLVIFMSDNGGPGGKNNGEFDANGGLRGNKGSIYEGGIRVPTIMRWPGKIEAGGSSDLVMDVSDLLPTFCELAGTPSPVGVDGVSLAPGLLGKGERRKREFLIHEAGKSQSIIRGKDKLVRTPKGLELYDLEADHGEERNLAKTKRKLVKELEALLLGERVDEPRGFANTYHHWTGKDGATTSDADNWSDYIYENAGITYMEDRGAPQVSWCALMANGGTAKGDADLAFLGLELRGKQELVLAPKIDLVGRNEIRLSRGSTLTVDGGTVSSLRWIDVLEGATLRGSGTVEADLYNAGTVEINAGQGGGKVAGLVVAGDYRESAGSALHLFAGSDGIAVGGLAELAGRLALRGGVGFRVGDTLPVLRAETIGGTFANPDGEVVADDGTRLVIRYSEHEITLEVIEISDDRS